MFKRSKLLLDSLSIKRIYTKLRPVFWKVMLLAIEIFGMYHVHLSYELAKQGYAEIASDLSSQILIYITAPFVTALVSKTIENVFEHNDIFIKRRKELDNLQEKEESEDLKWTEIN